MGAERIPDMVRALAKEERRVQLLHDAGVYITPVLLGTAIFAALPWLLSLALSPLVIHNLYSVGEYGTGSFEQRPFTATLIGAVIGFVGTIAWRFYQQGPVEIVLDEEGITETEWGTARLTIPWKDARAWSKEQEARSKYGQRYELAWLRIAAPSGEMIAFNNVDRGLLVPTLPRRMVARQNLQKLVAIARELPSLDAKASDPRVREVMGGLAIRIFRPLGMFLIFWSIGAMAAELGDFQYPMSGSRAFALPSAAIGSAVLFAGSFLQFIVPLRRYLRLRRRVAEEKTKAARVPVGGYREAEVRDDGPRDETLRYERIRVLTAFFAYGFAVVALTALPWLWRIEHTAQCEAQQRSCWE